MARADLSRVFGVSDCLSPARSPRELSKTLTGDGKSGLLATGATETAGGGSSRQNARLRWSARRDDQDAPIISRICGARHCAAGAGGAAAAPELLGAPVDFILFGLTLLSHQTGGFFGAYLGGLAVDATGNYLWMWYADIALASMAALVNLPIREAPVAPQPAAA